jgi:thymidylate kinase
MTLLLAVTGVAPAVGKSTLARGLCDWLREVGLTVDHVEEDELLTRPGLAPIAREIAVQESVTVDTLVSTLAGFLSSSDNDVVAMDALFPFVTLLSEWGYGEHRIAGFCAEAASRLTGIDVVVVYLDAHAGAALRHATDREPAGWLEWYVEGLARTKTSPAYTEFEAAVDRLERERALTLRLVAQQPWELVVIANADKLSVEAVLDEARSGLEERGLVVR